MNLIINNSWSEQNDCSFYLVENCFFAFISAINHMMEMCHEEYFFLIGLQKQCQNDEMTIYIYTMLYICLINIE